MLNKKIGLLVMSAAMLGLVACGGGQQSSSQQTGQSSAGGTSQQTGVSSEGDTSHATGLLPNIPEVEGKIAVYFTYEDVADGNALADMPSWCSPFITGNWNGYSTTPDAGALEMTRLAADSHVFYAYLPADGDFGDMGYQITLGYNAASGVGTGKQGINWSYKTIYSNDNFPGLDHPVLTKMNDKVYAALNSDHPASPMAFKDWLPEPVSVKNASMKFKVDLGNLVMGDNLEFVVKGSFNGWTTVSVGAPDKDGFYNVPLGDLVAVEEGDDYYEIIVGTYEMCFGVRNKLVGGDMEDKYTLARNQNETNVDVQGGEETVKEETDQVGSLFTGEISNIILGMSAIDGDNFVYNVGTLVAPHYAKGEQGVLLDTIKFALPSNEAPMLANSYVIRLENTGAAFEGTVPCIAGSFVGWNEPHYAMDVVEEGKVWEYVIEPETIHVGVKQEFKFTDGVWGSCEVAPENAEGKVDGNFDITPDQGDLGIKITADMGAWGGKVAGTPSPLGDILFGEDDAAAIVVWNTAATAAETVTIAGDFQGWDPAATPLVYDAGNDCYGTFLSLNGKKHGDKINFKITNGTWDKALGKAGGNYELVISYGVTIYGLDADLLNFEGDLTPHIAEVL